jgi:peptide/nickel transport system substrate-binding protein
MQKPVSEVYNAYVFRDFQLHLWQWQPDYVDPDCNAKAFAHSDSAGDDATIKLVAWFCRYVNLETSKLVEQASLESNNEKREAIYKKITDIILDDGPFAILYVPKKQYGIRLEARDFIGIPSVIWSNFPTIR